MLRTARCLSPTVTRNGPARAAWIATLSNRSACPESVVYALVAVSPLPAFSTTRK
jgi:hypothetical protein